MNMPLANAFCTSCWATSASCFGAAAAGQRWRGLRDDADAGDLRERFHLCHHDLLRRSGPLAPGFRRHAAEAAARERDLEDAGALRERTVDVVNLVGEQPGLLERGVGGRLHEVQEEPLILDWRQLALG